MRTYGVRIYPKSTTVERGAGGTPIFIHRRVDDQCSDFYYIFNTISYLWKGHVIAHEIGYDVDDQGEKHAPPYILDLFGDSVAGLDLDAQVILLKVDDFLRWGREVHFCQSAVVPIFWQPPSCDYLQKQFRVEYWHVTSESWPEELRAILHMYDDVYWELYSVVESDVQALIRVHIGDTRLNLYYVDLETEYPYSTNQKLVPVD